MDSERKPLTPILSAGNNNNNIIDRFDTATAADDYGPLPRGVYVAIAESGKLETARTGTPCYTVVFRVIEGEYTGRKQWMKRYLTDAALPYSKRDLTKLGLDTKAKLTAPFPSERLVCRLTVVLQTGDDQIESNEIKKIELIRVQEPIQDPFAPIEVDGGTSTGASAGADTGVSTP